MPSRHVARRPAPKRSPKARAKPRSPAAVAKALKFDTLTFAQFKRLSLANKVRFIRWNDPQGEWGFLSSPSNRDHLTLDGIAASMF